MEKSTGDSRELDLISFDHIKGFIKKNIKFCFLAALLGGVVTVVYVMTIPNEFLATATVLPEFGTGKTGGGINDIRTLASLAGMDIGGGGSGTDAIRPDLYPDVLKTVLFGQYILDQKIVLSNGGKSIPLRDFLKREPEVLLHLPNFKFWEWSGKSSEKRVNNPDPNNLSKTVYFSNEERALINEVILDRILPVYDKKTGITTISVKMGDPVVAAMVARLSLDYLKNYITSYRTEKIQRKVMFLTDRLVLAKDKFQNKQVRLQSYKDQNFNPFLNVAKIAENRLESDYQLAQTTYTQLAQELEFAKLKLNEETPVFKELNPPVIPNKKSEPKRIFYVIGGIILGASLAFVYKIFRIWI